MLFNGRIVIWLSFVIAMLLQVVPWPGDFSYLRPTWILLFTAYWVLALPHRVNVGTALVLGLIWDLMLGSTLGVRGLTMSIVCYVIALNFQVLRNLSLWKQALIIASISLAAKLIEFWAEYLVNPVVFDIRHLWGVLLNFLLWPWLFLLLRRVRRQFTIK
uniref:rod shape-determining protein MreD n=1 Tax=Thaumasiovibrio occultus TaxID=1891184 RepID=UPI000B34C759|nr:rod shape-determining protein MreD [Thaumasiovibrio occultus]